MFSQSATTKVMMPLGLALGLPAPALIAMFPAVNSDWVLPGYPTLLAAIHIDKTGTTRIGKWVVNHSFMRPGLVTVITAIAGGSLCWRKCCYRSSYSYRGSMAAPGFQIQDGVDIPILEAVGPAVKVGAPIFIPGSLDGRHLGEVHDLFADIELDQAVYAGFFIGDGVELFLVNTVHVLDIAKPLIEDGFEVGSCHSGPHAPATIVAADDDVFDL